jgi:uncharacterized lipoprotein YddW (UPF0748 family)
MKHILSLNQIIKLVVFLSLPMLLQAQPAPKREMRGVWIASVLNIDYPSVPTQDDYVLRDNWLKILKQHKEIGLNAVFVQVRPSGDALYKSNLVPWSRYLTGQSGLAPNNDFDPLGFMIKTTHELGMEFHAWLNPYRASMDNQPPSTFHESHVMRQHPEWCIKYNKRYIMNPGLPEVRVHVNEVVAELARNYDLDGIHFDDYFYPYKVAGETFNDYSTFQQYNNGITNIEDWRRENVDLLIYNLYKTIKSIKPRMQFGISPFGVWRNQHKDPRGSATQAGITCYDDLYADVLKWLNQGWIDYVMPQVYWQIGFNIADYEKIVRWWVDNSYGKPVYIGHGAYRVGQNSSREPNWRNPNEIPRQIQLARSLKGIKGSVYFSSKSLTNNALGVADSLKYNYYAYPAITPEVIRDTSLLACEPAEIRPITSENGQVLLRWKTSQLTQKRIPHQYIVYRFEPGKVDFTNGRNIIALVPHDARKELIFYDPNTEEDDTFLYAITVVDCINRETPADEVLSNKTSPIVNTKKAPVVVKKKKHKTPFLRRFWHWLF